MIERDLRGATAAGPPGHGMRERLTVYGFFVIMGIGTSAWISRLPTVKARLGLQPSGLALMTILDGSGALIGMLVSGVLTDQLGVRKAMLLAASTWCMGMLIVALAVTLRSVPGVVLGLLFNSAGISLWGTVNTVEAGAVERFSSRSIMPRFHASYSLGMFLALGLGSLLSHLGVPIVTTLATRDPAMAAQRASVISTAYYRVSWIIPPAIGFLADHTGVRLALLPLALLLAAATLLVPSAAGLTRE